MSLDGAERRRVYLFRHGAVDYVDSDGQVVPDPDSVHLNERGQEEARAMCVMFAEVGIDTAICSGLRRTRETAAIVLGDRSVDLEVESGLEEIRPATDRQPDYDLYRDVAHSHWRADEPGSRFLGGEHYSDFYSRVSKSFSDLVARPDWHDMAVFAHGGTNAAVLGWVTGLGLNAFGLFDQATCCLPN